MAFGIIFWETPPGSNSVGLINAKGKIGWLPNIGKNSYLMPILIVLGLALILFVYMRYTKQGYEITVVGESENTAHYAGRVLRAIEVYYKYYFPQELPQNGDSSPQGGN